jgi:DNA-binding response OmpR family regulator
MAKILFVEDDIVFGDSLCDYLESLGHIVQWEKDGETALKMSEKSFDIYIFDIDIPLIDGFELLKAIREQENHTPCLYLTAKDDTESLKLGFKVGANDYLKKPFDLIELEMRIKALLNSAQIATNKILTYKTFQYDTTIDEFYQNGETVNVSIFKLKIIRALFEKREHKVSIEYLQQLATPHKKRNDVKETIKRINKECALDIQTSKTTAYLL